MANLTFADSHNIVAYLEKSTKNADFAEIVDFLNSSHIRKTKRKAIEISQSSGPTIFVADETVYEERGDRVERAATTASSLEAEWDSGNILRTQSMATLNELIPQGTSSENLVACQDDKKKELEQEYILIPICTTDPLISQGAKDNSVDARKKAPEVDESEASDNVRKNDQVLRINIVGSSFVNAASQTPTNVAGPSAIDDNVIFGNAYDDEVLKEEVDMNNASGQLVLNGFIGTRRMKRNSDKEQSRLVAQGHTQKKGIDYDKVFAPVARIKPIRLFLAYASFKDFVVYQMYVKSAFLYRRIEEEVYVCQPPGFEDPNFPDKVYKVEKLSMDYIKPQEHGLWYPKDSPFYLEAYFDNDYVGASLDRKSTTGEYVVAAANCYGQVLWIQNQMLDYRLMIAKDERCFVDTFEVTTGLVSNPVPAAPYVPPTNKDLEILFQWMFDEYLEPSRVERLVSPTPAVPVPVNIAGTPSSTTIDQDAPSPSHSPSTSVLQSPCLQQSVTADNQKFNFSKYIFDNMVKSLEGGVKFYLFPRFLQVFLDKQVEGMARHKKLYIISSYTKKIFVNIKRMGVGFFGVLDLQKAMATQVEEITALKKKATKLNKWRKSRSGGLERLKKIGSGRRVKSPMEKDSLGAQEDASKQGRMIKEIDQNTKIALDDETQGKTNDDEMFRVDDLAGEEVVMDTTTGEHEEQIIEDVSTVELVTTAGDVVTNATVKISTTKPKVVVQEQEMSTIIPAAATTVTTIVPTPRAKGIVFHEKKQSQIPTVSSSKDKGKAKMIEPEVPIKKKDQMRIDEEYARKLEAKEQEAARLSKAHQDEEANNS
nr:copia protein [Tanacetum cinerariifolium]